MKKDIAVWDEMRQMQKNMDSLFRNFFNLDPLFENRFLIGENSTPKSDLITSNYVEPTSDLYETDKEIIAEIDLPGVDKKDIKVNVTKDSIEINAEKKYETKKEDKKKGMYRFERSYSGFCRKLALPNKVDADKADAEYKNGVLQIKIPKLKIEQQQKKLLEIK